MHVILPITVGLHYDRYLGIVSYQSYNINVNACYFANHSLYLVGPPHYDRYNINLNAC